MSHPACLTVRELAEITDHSQRTIRRWIATYLIKPVGWHNGANTYDVADILRAERDTRKAHERSLFAPSAAACHTASD